MDEISFVEHVRSVGFGPVPDVGPERVRWTTQVPQRGAVQGERSENEPALARAEGGTTTTRTGEWPWTEEAEGRREFRSSASLLFELTVQKAQC